MQYRAKLDKTVASVILTVSLMFIVAGIQDNSYNDHLRALRLELSKKHKAGELDSFGLYLYVV